MQSIPSQSASTRAINDRRLTQLDIIWNAEAFVTLITSAFEGSLTEHEAVGCRILRYRYRHGHRSIVLYELTLRHSISGIERLYWLTGTVHGDPGRMLKLYGKTLKQFRLLEQKDALNSHSPLPRVFYLPEVEMLVQQYPYDRYLPQLYEFYQQPWRTTVQSTTNRQADLVAHRYRPFLSATVEHRATLADAQSRFYKFYRADCAAANYAFLKKLASRNQSELYRLLAPVEYDNSLSAVVFQRAPGSGIDDLLNKPELNVPELARKTAAALHAFHTHGTIPGRIRTGADAQARATRAVALIEQADGQYGEHLKSVLSPVAHLFCEPVVPGASHLDIKPDHVLVGDQVTLIDLDSSANADPLADVAMMAVRLLAACENRQVNATACNEFLHSFLDTYFVLCSSRRRITFPLHLRLSWLKVCLFYVQHGLSDWQQRTRQLLSQSQQIEQQYRHLLS